MCVYYSEGYNFIVYSFHESEVINCVTLEKENLRISTKKLKSSKIFVNLRFLICLQR